MSNQENTWEQYKSDFQTPLEVAKYMCSLIPEGTNTVLEPTPGVGNIARYLSGKYDVTLPKDFFLLPESKWDCIVMNPPFSSKFANLENAPNTLKEKGMSMG
jgi:type I restriction-modification system DNA methylase subunit